jgi:hypothetical protein
MAQNKNNKDNSPTISPFSDKALIDALEQELLNAATVAKRASPSALSSAVDALRSSSSDLKETGLVHARLSIFSDSASRAVGIQWLRKQVTTNGGENDKRIEDPSVTEGRVDQRGKTDGLVSPSTKAHSELSLWLAVGLLEDGQFSSARGVLSSAILSDPGNERLGAMLEVYKMRVRKEGPAGLTLVFVGTVAVVVVSTRVWWYATSRGKTSSGNGGLRRR